MKTTIRLSSRHSARRCSTYHIDFATIVALLKQNNEHICCCYWSDCCARRASSSGAARWSSLFLSSGQRSESVDNSIVVVFKSRSRSKEVSKQSSIRRCGYECARMPISVWDEGERREREERRQMSLCKGACVCVCVLLHFLPSHGPCLRSSLLDHLSINR